MLEAEQAKITTRQRAEADEAEKQRIAEAVFAAQVRTTCPPIPIRLLSLYTESAHDPNNTNSRLRPITFLINVRRPFSSFT